MGKRCYETPFFYRKKTRTGIAVKKDVLQSLAWLIFFRKHIAQSI